MFYDDGESIFGGETLVIPVCEHIYMHMAVELLY